MRLDTYLAENHPKYSRSVWTKIIKRGNVSVNGKVVTSASKNVFESDIVTTTENLEEKQPLDLPIIFEDENVIVLNKPAGILTHSKGALNNEFTVADFVRESGEWRMESGKNSNRQGIVHRLDRGTSGVIIGAKNEATKKLLQKQFQDRKTKKTYMALVDVAPAGQKILDKNGEEFTIDLPIARNPKKPSQFRVDSRGKSAITNVKLVQLFDDKALLELKPLTGRTHQLRVHLAYVGLPIIGDIVYNEKKSNTSRMMLHAKELEITIPDGMRKVFKAELPDEFAKLK